MWEQIGFCFERWHAVLWEVMLATLKSHDSPLLVSRHTKNILCMISEYIWNFLRKPLTSGIFIRGWQAYQFIITQLWTPVFKIVLQELTRYQVIIYETKGNSIYPPVSLVEDNLLLQAILPSFTLNFLQNVMAFQESAYGLHLLLCILQVLHPQEVGILLTTEEDSLLCLLWVWNF